MRGKSKDTRADILNTAIELFSRSGFSETSMRDIALETKIQPGSIYNHFSSKQNLLEEILVEYGSFIEETSFLEEAVDKLIEEPSYDNLMACMNIKFSDDGNRLKKMVYIIMHEQHRNDAVKKYVSEQMIIKNMRYLKYIVERLMENDRIHPCDSDIIAMLHVAALYFWSNVSLIENDDPSTPPPVKADILPDVLRYLYQNTIRFKNC